jgi:hypothetical protein
MIINNHLFYIHFLVVTLAEVCGSGKSMRSSPPVFFRLPLANDFSKPTDGHRLDRIYLAECFIDIAVAV